MTIATRHPNHRHLAVVTNMTAHSNLTRAVTSLTAVTGQDAIPADVLDQLAELDANHQTACRR